MGVRGVLVIPMLLVSGRVGSSGFGVGTVLTLGVFAVYIWADFGMLEHLVQGMSLYGGDGIVVL
jgi:hypothetical protein